MKVIFPGNEVCVLYKHCAMHCIAYFNEGDLWPQDEERRRRRNIWEKDSGLRIWCMWNAWSFLAHLGIWVLKNCCFLVVLYCHRVLCFSSRWRNWTGWKSWGSRGRGMPPTSRNKESTASTSNSRIFSMRQFQQGCLHLISLEPPPGFAFEERSDQVCALQVCRWEPHADSRGAILQRSDQFA